MQVLRLTAVALQLHQLHLLLVVLITGGLECFIVRGVRGAASVQGLLVTNCFGCNLFFCLLQMIVCFLMLPVLAVSMWRSLLLGNMGVTMLLLLCTPKTDGDAISLGQRLLGVLPKDHRFWAAVHLSHVEDWFLTFVLERVCIAGGGRSSVHAFFSTALDPEESLRGVPEHHVHVPAAAAVHPCDTVDRDILYFYGVWAGLTGFARLRGWWHHQKCPPGVMFALALYLSGVDVFLVLVASLHTCVQNNSFCLIG